MQVQTETMVMSAAKSASFVVPAPAMAVSTISVCTFSASLCQFLTTP